MPETLPPDDEYAVVAKTDLLALLQVYEDMLERDWIARAVVPLPEQIQLVRRINQSSGRLSNLDESWYARLGLTGDAWM